MTNIDDKQIGGKHYKQKTQHWNVVTELGWDYYVGNATKYLWRLGKKHPSLLGQLEDLNKSIHYLEKKKELLEAELNRELDDILGEEPQPKGYVDQD